MVAASSRTVGYGWLLYLFLEHTQRHSVRRVDTGFQVTNMAWSKDSSELVSFLYIKVDLSFVVEMVFLTKRKESLLYSEQMVKYFKVVKFVCNT
jgi:hypothetical protein